MKAADRIRTDDLRFTKPLLYRLSYGGKLLWDSRLREQQPTAHSPGSSRRANFQSSRQKQRRSGLTHTVVAPQASVKERGQALAVSGVAPSSTRRDTRERSVGRFPRSIVLGLLNTMIAAICLRDSRAGNAEPERADAVRL